MPMVLQLLDTMAFRRPDDHTVDIGAVSTTKALDLLRLLAGDGGRPRAAHYYAARLWPEADESRRGMSLRTALAQVRRALGPDVVRRTGDLLGLGDVDTDVARLRRDRAEVERLVRAGRDTDLLAVAVALQAECGTDLVVSDTSCGAVHALRGELRRMRRQVLLDGAEAAHRSGHTRECLALALEADELERDEASVRLLMRAWAAAGETARVIEAFEELRSTLAGAYGVPPSPQTRAVYLQVVTADQEPGRAPAEHHRELADELAGCVRDLARSGSGTGVVWLHGQPGSGRATVAREALQQLRREAPGVAERVYVVPELVQLPDTERARLRADAVAHDCVLVVPVRCSPTGQPTATERVLTVGALDREAFRQLLAHLLQDDPAATLENRLWTSTSGLVGQTTRTVAALVQSDALRWSQGSVDLAPRPIPSQRRPEQSSSA